MSSECSNGRKKNERRSGIAASKPRVSARAAMPRAF
jgi:hypothetical protein